MNGSFEYFRNDFTHIRFDIFLYTELIGINVFLICWHNYYFSIYLTNVHSTAVQNPRLSFLASFLSFFLGYLCNLLASQIV